MRSGHIFSDLKMWIWNLKKEINSDGLAVECEKRKEIRDETVALAWANRAWVAFNWHIYTHNCRRSDFKEEDQDVSSGHVKFEMPIRSPSFGVKHSCQDWLYKSGNHHVIMATKVIMLSEITKGMTVCREQRGLGLKPWALKCLKIRKLKKNQRIRPRKIHQWCKKESRMFCSL